MTKINAKIIADSISPQGHRITTYILTYPRFIHAEVMTHRMFSRNAASSRAIPFAKMVKSVEENPFIPIAWQKDHKGMQGSEYIDPYNDENCAPIADWLDARDSSVEVAKEMNADGVTKQLCNRLLEPFLWYTNLVTATEYDNFFELRCPQYKVPGTNTDVTSTNIYRSKKDAIKDYPSMKSVNDLDWIKLSKSHAEIHIQALAEAMWDAKNESTPSELGPGEWHIPFGDRMDVSKFSETFEDETDHPILTGYKLKVATARAARLSYETHDGEIDYEKDIKMHDQLLERKHASCFEHCARVMDDMEYYSYINGEVSSQRDGWGILNYEYYPLLEGKDSSDYMGQKPGPNKNNANRYGWCRNLRGFIPYRHIVNL